ncbi:type I-E CRISPR-associated protein Cas5/CasD [Austwickia chelonae]|uniref:type I-E CRISPR-associated protein Cas5/CasD n=1 Tax=Austwickia chelonae TaxID=100225 RepID=UPI000E21DC06|nr:type I-E CRISPR-associated protein Cas5/CasD [Austwickia chelonae]
MAVLLLRLAGPLQSWGDSSRFARRNTRTSPTKSGVFGLLAAAQGRRRTDPIEDLLGLRFGVRVDQPGRLVRDFQTAIRWTSPKPAPMPLSYRYYLADAVFTAAVEGDHSLVQSLDEAVRSPAFPLYLGRRSCPPSRPVSMSVFDGSLVEVLREAPWQAASWHRRELQREVRLEILVDADSSGGSQDIFPEEVRDLPQSWNPERREYLWRSVVSVDPVLVDNPIGRADRRSASSEPDFFAEVGGVPCT